MSDIAAVFFIPAEGKTSHPLSPTTSCSLGKLREPVCTLEDPSVLTSPGCSTHPSLGFTSHLLCALYVMDTRLRAGGGVEVKHTRATLAELVLYTGHKASTLKSITKAVRADFIRKRHS